MEVTTTNLDLTEVKVPLANDGQSGLECTRQEVKKSKQFTWAKTELKARRGDRKRRDRQTDGQFLDSSFRFNVPSTTRERKRLAGRQTDRQTERQRGTRPDRSVSMRQNDSGKSAVQARSENYPRYFIRTSR